VSVRATVGDLNIAFELCCIGRVLASINSKSKAQSFIFYTILSLRRALKIFNVEDTVFGSVNKNEMANLPVLIPTEEAINDFE
jgi:type I restriction enzyme S subunit